MSDLSYMKFNRFILFSIFIILLLSLLVPVAVAGSNSDGPEFKSSGDAGARGARANLPPTVNMTQPANQSEVKNTIEIKGNSNDDYQVVSVNVIINGTAYLATDISGKGDWSTWNYTLDTTQYKDGWWWITVNATDNGTLNGSAKLYLRFNNSAPPPNNKPTITISSPADNATVNGTIKIQGTASDDNKVTDVKILISSFQYSPTDTSGGGDWSTWELSFDTTTKPDGDYSVMARAFDGSEYGFDTIIIKINNSKTPVNQKPSIAFTQPLNNTEVSGKILIEGTAGDDNKVMSVKIIINSVQYDATDLSGNGSWHTWNYTLNTELYPNNWLRVYAIAYDGELSRIIFLNVLVNNTVIEVNQPPKIWIVSPTNNSEVNGTITISGFAVDDLKIEYVRLIVNGTMHIPADTSGNSTWYSWELELNTSALNNDYYLVRAEASDGEFIGSAFIAFTVNNAPEIPDVNILPKIKIIQPEHSATVNGTITIQGIAWDPDTPITMVTIYIGSYDLNASDDSTNGTWYHWSLVFDTTLLGNSLHTITAKVFEPSGFGYDEIEIIVDNEYPVDCP
ncbi:MAG: hypothetical protein JSV49_11070, partial [Thermoplasmata archaeon]